MPARILIPGQLFGEPGTGNHIGIAVAVHIQGEIAQVIDVAFDKGNFSHAMLFPIGCFKPIFSANDIQTPVLVDVCNSRRFVGTFIKQMFSKHRPVRSLVVRLVWGGGKDEKREPGQ